jgi:hypothetical protein
MLKFNVGDKVRIKNGYNNPNPSPNEIYTINQVNEVAYADGVAYVFYYCDEMPFVIYEDWLEAVNDV